MSQELEARIRDLNEMVGGLYREGRRAEALDLGLQVLDAAVDGLGDRHWLVGESLNNLGTMYDAFGDADRARHFYERAIETLRSREDADPRLLATTIASSAVFSASQADYDAAEDLFREALAIRREALAPDDPEVRRSIQSLATLREAIGDVAGADELLREERDVGGSLVDPWSLPYLLLQQAAMFKAEGKYVAAEAFARHAVESARRRLGESHLWVAQSLNNLSEIFDIQGKLEEADSCYREALAALDGSEPDGAGIAALIQTNLGLLRFREGDYRDGDALLRESLDARISIHGPEHPFVATTLNNLGLVRFGMGDLAGARELFGKALAINRAALPEWDAQIADTLNNLGATARAAGDYEGAVDFYVEALERRRATLGGGHPAVAESLNNVAALLMLMGANENAESLFREALAIRRQSFGDRNADVAATINNLGLVAQRSGRYDEAEQCFGEGLAVLRDLFGNEHPQIVGVIFNLAELLATRGRRAEAITLMLEALAVESRVTGAVFSFTSDRQRMSHLARVRASLDVFLSLVSLEPTGVRHLVEEAYDVVLGRKGLAAEALSVQREAALGGRHPQLAERLNELGQLKASIGRSVLAGPGPEGKEQHRELLSEWTTKKERSEAELARAIPEMDLRIRREAATAASVRAQLPRSSALVEFVRFDVRHFDAMLAPTDPWGPPRYIAFVVHGKGMQPVDLGHAEPIDELVRSFKESLATSFPSAGKEWVPPGLELRRAVFEPLVESLAGSTRLFFAPDGALSSLPFEVLPSGGDAHLLDLYEISYLTTGRDLLLFERPWPIRSGPSLVVADPDFDLASDALGDSAPGTRQPERQSRDLDRSDLIFTRLPGTRREGEAVAHMLGVTPLLDGDALESRIKACRSPRILHMATHGFFLPDEGRPWYDRSGVPEGSRSTGTSTTMELTSSENPMLRSGLALASANTWLRRRQPPQEAEDGFLTAEDACGLDLSGTELVILSACDTGLGAIQNGEGVFGLRRALMLAGAKTLIMSLWKVPDQETYELMRYFYEALLDGGSRAGSLRAAQRRVREHSPHPINWGGFICQGSPGAL